MAAPAESPSLLAMGVVESWKSGGCVACLDKSWKHKHQHPRNGAQLQKLASRAMSGNIANRS
ncbi:hypothetical protein C2857_000378 [Epichloe festucae Fl1]|uniref:Uncharacterized protein n=1 Tax=Epichloe festucae (strain Fl1) TaxID=877507 RepID=A0A7S9PV10_EPIFF|nr:hypothetical protein C2857_000378 [Epichloe festucae Fl1]